MTTRGAGAYKFSEATVLALPADVFSSVEAQALDKIATARALGGLSPNIDQRAIRHRVYAEAIASSTPIAITRTDADGFYSLAYSSRQPVVIVCTTSRLTGRDVELNFWAVPVAGDDRIDLTSSNAIL